MHIDEETTLCITCAPHVISCSIQRGIGRCIAGAASWASDSCNAAEQRSLMQGSCACCGITEVQQANGLWRMHGANGRGRLLLQGGVPQYAARMDESSNRLRTTGGSGTNGSCSISAKGCIALLERDTG